MLNVLTVIENVAFRGVEERLAEFLLLRVQGGSPAFRITHEELAMELGTAREVVSRTLKTLEKNGAVSLRRGSVEILSREILMASLKAV